MINRDISKPLPLKEKGHSLDPDMMFGWKPGRHIPIPFKYSLNLKQPHLPLIYKAFRPSNSSEISKNSKKELQVHKPVFSSDFESGNLDEVYMVSETEFDLYLRCDTNTKGYLHWFYFSISGVNKGETLRLNILNFSRSCSLYGKGMQVKVLSSKTSHWEDGGENLSFAHSKVVSNNAVLYSLSFDYTFKHKDDLVYFATSIPYTFSQLQGLIASLPNTKKSVLCKSLCQIEVPLLTITSPNKSKKKVVFVVGRVHPAESVASWVVEGFLLFITGEHPHASQLRDRYIFKIVPMINVDGVIVGNSRTCVSGQDLNRHYVSPKKEIHPSLHAIKKLVASLDVFMFFDIHGHLEKKGSFIYGPHFPVYHSKYYVSKIIPKVFSELTDVFRYFSCRFKEENKKHGAARVVMQREFGIEYSYTLETSYYGYFDSLRNSYSFDVSILHSIGENLAKSIYSFCEIADKKQNRTEKTKLQQIVSEIKEDELKDNLDSESESSDTEEASDTLEISTISKKNFKKKDKVLKSLNKRKHEEQLPQISISPIQKQFPYRNRRVAPCPSPVLRREYLPKHFNLDTSQEKQIRERMEKRFYSPVNSTVYKTQHTEIAERGLRSKSTVPEIYTSSMMLYDRIPDSQIQLLDTYIPHFCKGNTYKINQISDIQIPKLRNGLR